MNLLYKHNPWWIYEDWEEKDFHLRNWKKQKIKWIPKWINKISIKPFSLNFVIGPRQVGKTTGIKLLIKKLIDGNYNPYQIFYFNCDFLSDMKDLQKILEEYFVIRKKEGIDSSIIFLDEITSLEFWWKIIKGFIDLGYFENDVLILSGSSSAKAKKYSEAFPGRRGFGRVVEVLPLSFPEFIEILGYNLEKIVYEHEELLALWNKYKTKGGFPRSINDDESFALDFVESIEREVYKLDKDADLFRKIIVKIVEKLPNSISYNAIANDLGISHHSVKDYVVLGQDLYIFGVAYWKHNDKVDYKKEKKIFLRDPFIFYSFSEIYGAKFEESALIENIVQEHIFRKFGEIYYYKNSYEIDVIANNLKIEIKSTRSHRKNPKDVIILSEEEIPEFLIKLYLNKLDF